MPETDASLSNAPASGSSSLIPSNPVPAAHEIPELAQTLTRKMDEFMTDMQGLLPECKKVSKPAHDHLNRSTHNYFSMGSSPLETGRSWEPTQRINELREGSRKALDELNKKATNILAHRKTIKALITRLEPLDKALNSTEISDSIARLTAGLRARDNAAIDRANVLSSDTPEPLSEPSANLASTSQDASRINTTPDLEELPNLARTVINEIINFAKRMEGLLKDYGEVSITAREKISNTVDNVLDTLSNNNGSTIRESDINKMIQDLENGSQEALTALHGKNISGPFAKGKKIGQAIDLLTPLHNSIQEFYKSPDVNRLRSGLAHRSQLNVSDNYAPEFSDIPGLAYVVETSTNAIANDMSAFQEKCKGVSKDISKALSKKIEDFMKTRGSLSLQVGTPRQIDIMLSDLRVGAEEALGKLRKKKGNMPEAKRQELINEIAVLSSRVHLLCQSREVRHLSIGLEIHRPILDSEGNLVHTLEPEKRPPVDNPELQHWLAVSMGNEPIIGVAIPTPIKEPTEDAPTSSHDSKEGGPG